MFEILSVSTFGLVARSQLDKQLLFVVSVNIDGLAKVQLLTQVRGLVLLSIYIPDPAFEHDNKQLNKSKPAFWVSMYVPAGQLGKHTLLVIFK
jgi:hypothetical protein